MGVSVRARVCVGVCVRAPEPGFGQGLGRRLPLFSGTLISSAERVGALGGRPWDVPGRCPVFSQTRPEHRPALLCQILGRLVREPASLLPSEWGPGGESPAFPAPRLAPRRPLLSRGSIQNRTQAPTCERWTTPRGRVVCKQNCCQSSRVCELQAPRGGFFGTRKASLLEVYSFLPPFISLLIFGGRHLFQLRSASSVLFFDDPFRPCNPPFPTCWNC